MPAHSAAETCYLVLSIKDNIKSLFHIIISILWLLSVAEIFYSRFWVFESRWEKNKVWPISSFLTLRTYVLCDIPRLRGQSLFAWQEGKKQCCHPSLDLQYGPRGKGRGGALQGRPWMGSRPPSEENQSLGGAPPPTTTLTNLLSPWSLGTYQSSEITLHSQWWTLWTCDSQE